MKLALVRHPATAAPPDTCYGRLDVTLHAHSGAALRAIVDVLSKVPARHVWSSPARRCRDTAEAITTSLRLQLCVDARLRELDFGAWEGRAWNTLPRAELDRWAASPASFAPPGGESGASLLSRVASFHTELQRAQQDCIVVAHGGSLKLLAALLRGEPPDLLAPAPTLGSVTMVSRVAGAPAS